MNKGSSKVDKGEKIEFMSPKRSVKKHSSFDIEHSFEEIIDKGKRVRDMENEKKFKQLEKRMERLIKNAEELRDKPKINKLSKEYYGVIGRARRNESQSWTRRN